MATLARRYVVAAAERYGLDPELPCALATVRTRWDLAHESYDPTYDALEVQRRRAVFQGHPEWIADGPTAEDFFQYHPARRREAVPGLSYGFVAQTVLAARYGPFALRYPVALQAGFVGHPQELLEPDGYGWGVLDLARQVRWAIDQGYDHRDAAALGLARSNGEFVADARRAKSLPLVQAVDQAYRVSCGRSLL